MNFKIILVVIAVLIGVIGIGVLGGDDTAQVDSNREYTRLTVTEAGDFECPACASFHPIVKEVKEIYEDRVDFEFKHFPLTAIHPNAYAAHRAAQAAANQGKFWEMHDVLFERRNSWISNTTNDPVLPLEALAESIGLDMDQYRTDFTSSAVNDFIQNDIALSRDLGAQATPTFFINGELVENRELDSVEKFSALLDSRLNESSEQ